jgi:proteic killer suppression protein
MLKSFRHKGLKRLFEQDDPSGVNPEHVGKLKNILATLHAAPTVRHMDLPAFRLHPLKGDLKRLLGRDGTRQLAGDFPLWHRRRGR